MGVVLSKGGSVSLTKEANAPLTTVLVGLGWDPIPGMSVDLDASVLIVGAGDRVLSDAHFVFYNNPASPDGAVTHSGDDTGGTSSDGGDDETITVNLAALPSHAVAVRVAVTIHNADALGQSFRSLTEAYIRVVNVAGGTELARFDLTDVTESSDALLFAELRRDGSDWRFQAIGDGYNGGLAGIARAHGVDV